MKKLVSVLMIAVLSIALIGSTYAEETSNDEKAEEINVDLSKDTIELSLEEAISIAMEKNRDIEIQSLNIQQSEKKYESEMDDIEDFEDKIEEHDGINFDKMSPEMKQRYSMYQGPIEQKKLLEYGVMERGTELTFNIAKWNKEIKKNEIQYNITKSYYDLLLAEKSHEIAKESVELAERQYQNGKKMYELGTISKQNLISMEVGVSQAKSGLNAANLGYEMQLMNFNNTLGIDMDKDIVLTDDITYSDYELIALNEAIDEALNTNKMIQVAEENYELSKLRLKATNAKYHDGSYRYLQEKIGVEKTAKSLESAKKGIEMAVRSSYAQMITAEEQINTYRKAVDKSQKALELAELSFELGENTSTDVNQARIDLMNAKKDLAKQIHSYNMAKLDFDYSMGIGKQQISSGY